MLCTKYDEALIPIMHRKVNIEDTNVWNSIILWGSHR